MSTKPTNDEIRDAVKTHYAQAVTQKSSCCGSGSTPLDPGAPGKYVQMAGYTSADLSNLPEGVSTFGCGNPVSVMEVQEGQTVLDLGSGAGLDLILAARKVGPKGKVIGLDMTDEMIDTCRANLEQAGIKNADLRLGVMEAMPVADAEVDWIISNCVINLSPEKEKVFAESFRVLKPGGRVLVSDIVTIDLPDEMRDDLNAWVGCIAGAIDQDEYLGMMRQAGFTDVKVIDTMVYTEAALTGLGEDACGCADGSAEISKELLAKYANRVASVKIYAAKPA
jgi:SAM-dependent methyltransferase